MTKIKKIVAGITAFACLVGACVGVVAVLDKPIGNQSVDQFAGLVTEQTESNGMALLMGETLNADGSTVADSVTVTATLTTVGTAYDATLQWGIAFKTDSEWATGKSVNAYVTMTVAEDTHSVTLDCVKAFGEPIVITATSVDNSTVSASCQLDYVKRIKSVTQLECNSGVYTNCIGIDDKKASSHAINTVNVVVEYDEGTIAPTVDISEMKLRMGSALANTLSSVYIPNTSVNQPANIMTPEVTCEAVQGDTLTGTFQIEVSDFVTGPEFDMQGIENYFYQNAYDATTGNFNEDFMLQVMLNIGVTYGDKTYQEYTYAYLDGMRIARGALTDHAYVTGVDLSQSNIVF